MELIALCIPTRGDKHQHVAKKRPRGVWSDAMIRHILKNETYTGVWHYGKTKMVSDGHESSRKQVSKRGLGKQVPRSEDDWIAVPVPAITSHEREWNARIQVDADESERAKRGLTAGQAEHAPGKTLGSLGNFRWRTLTLVCIIDLRCRSESRGPSDRRPC